jgi:ferredoxin-type protein NapF
MAMDINRRRFMRGGAGPVELRPPWLLDPASFTESCTRCNKCIELCPQDILVAGGGGFPRVEFSQGECTFCGDCTRHCEAELFDQILDNKNLGWTHKVQVGEGCLTNFGVMCRSCEDACEPRAIRFPLVAGKVPQPTIDIDACTGCGACIRPCPETAISLMPERNPN